VKHLLNTNLTSISVRNVAKKEKEIIKKFENIAIEFFMLNLNMQNIVKFAYLRYAQYKLQGG